MSTENWKVEIHLLKLLLALLLAGFIGAVLAASNSNGFEKRLKEPCYRIGEKMGVREIGGSIVTYMCVSEARWVPVKYQGEP